MPSIFEPSGCNINNNTNSYSRAYTNDCNNDHANGSTPAGISTRDSFLCLGCGGLRSHALRLRAVWVE